MCSQSVEPIWRNSDQPIRQLTMTQHQGQWNIAWWITLVLFIPMFTLPSSKHPGLCWLGFGSLTKQLTRQSQLGLLAPDHYPTGCRIKMAVRSSSGQTRIAVSAIWSVVMKPQTWNTDLENRECGSQAINYYHINKQTTELSFTK